MVKTWQIRYEPRCAACGECLGAPEETQRGAEEQVEGEGYGKICRYCDSYLDDIEIVAVARLCADPIATVRQAHPRAFALPPGALYSEWSIIPDAAVSPLPKRIASGATEAEAWAAAASLPAYDDPIWSEPDREFWREEGISLTTGEVMRQGHAATRCSYCGTVDDDPPEEIEDHCDECGQTGYISSGYAVYSGLALYFLGTE